MLAHCAPVSTAACSVGVFVEPLAWMDLRPAWQRLPSQRPAAELPPPTAELDAWAAGTRLADEVGAIPEAAAQGFWPTDGPREGKLVCPVPACAQKLGAWSVERARCVRRAAGWSPATDVGMAAAVGAAHVRPWGR